MQSRDNHLYDFLATSFTQRTIESFLTSNTVHSSCTFNLLCHLVAYSHHFFNLSHFFTDNS